MALGLITAAAVERNFFEYHGLAQVTPGFVAPVAIVLEHRI